MIQHTAAHLLWGDHGEDIKEIVSLIVKPIIMANNNVNVLD